MAADWMDFAQKMAQAARVKLAEDRRKLEDIRALQLKRQVEQVTASSPWAARD
jgi:hypothetical protein